MAATFKIEKLNDYTIMANHHLRNRKLSLKAKGLQSLMLSLPEECTPASELPAGTLSEAVVAVTGV